jgi:ATP synthase protein I
MADPRHPHGSDALDELAKRVAALHQERKLSVPQVNTDRSGMSLGLRLASEFASAILVGGLLGYGIDYLVKSSPWGLLVGLALGFVTGTVNLIRASRQMTKAHHVDPQAFGLRDDQDEDA